MDLRTEREVEGGREEDEQQRYQEPGQAAFNLDLTQGEEDVVYLKDFAY